MDETELAAARAVAVAVKTRQATRALEHLMGMVTGMLADQQLNKLEIQMLATWLGEHKEVTLHWPGFVIARKVEEIMEDGVITEVERAHLQQVLTDLIASEFAITGSTSPEVSNLPINDVVTVILRNAGVCHTGEFMFGTRAACERATLKAGGMPSDSVSKKVQYVVVGTRVSPAWAHTSFGRKIQRAAELQQEGCPIEIISERRWLESMQTPREL
jgi:NAD-dependent DNA ligase